MAAASRVPALALVCLVLAACGGNGAGPPTQEAGEQHAQYVAGLQRWGADMRGALNGVSALFARPADVRAIEAGSPRVHALLRRYEQTLAACSARVRRLGRAPGALSLARLEALHACTSIERGGRLVRAGVSAVGGGAGFGLLDRASDVLTTGEDGLRRALLDLAPAP